MLQARDSNLYKKKISSMEVLETSQSNRKWKIFLFWQGNEITTTWLALPTEWELRWWRMFRFFTQNKESLLFSNSCRLGKLKVSVLRTTWFSRKFMRKIFTSLWGCSIIESNRREVSFVVHITDSKLSKKGNVTFLTSLQLESQGDGIEEQKFNQKAFHKSSFDCILHVSKKIGGKLTY